MESFLAGIGRAPFALAPAVRLVQPVLLDNPQQPLLPWPAPLPADAAEDGIAEPVQRVVGQLTAGLVEVLRGRRPLDHLEAHTSAPVYDLLGHLRRARSLPELRLASLRLCQPAEAVVEAAVRLSLGGRSRAAALRFAERAGRWRLTELELALDPDVVLRAG